MRRGKKVGLFDRRQYPEVGQCREDEEEYDSFYRRTGSMMCERIHECSHPSGNREC